LLSIAIVEKLNERPGRMSLYYDAISILTAPATTGGSFKSRIYSSKTLKSSPAQVFALVTEASKWDVLLKEVIENAGILSLEHKVSHRPPTRLPLVDAN
jgi:putative methyltransferase